MFHSSANQSVLMMAISRYIANMIVGLILWWCTPVLVYGQAMQYTVPGDSAMVRKQLKQAGEMKRRSPDSAMVLLQQIYSKCRLSHDDHGAVLALLESSNVLNIQAQYRRSMAMVQQALMHCSESNHPELLAAVYNNWGSIYNYLSMYDSAVYFYLKALDYKQQFSEPGVSRYPPIGYIYNNIASSFLELENEEQAFVYFQKTYQAASLQHDTALLAVNFNNLGGYYFKKERWDSCRTAYESAVTYSKRSGADRLLFIAYIGLGNLYDKLQVSDSALHYSLAAYSLYGEGGVEKHGYNTLLCNIGNIYKMREKYDDALRFYGRALADESRTPKESALLYGRLAELYAALGEYEKAYDYKERYQRLNDSLKSADIAVKISDLESRFELSRQGKELVESRAATRQRNLWLWILSGISLSGIVVGGVWYKLQQRRQRAEQMLLELNARMAGEEEEKSRIAHELHDGAGSQLTAVKSFLIAAEQRYPQLHDSGDFAAAKNILSETAVDIRRMAHNLAPDILLHNGLVATVSSFCEKLFTASGMDYSFETAGNLDGLPPKLSLMIYRVVQELSNNVIKHSGATTVTVLLTENGQQVDLVVADNGSGFTKAHIKPGNGWGIRSIEERIALFGGRLFIESVAGAHTTLHVSVPFGIVKEADIFVFCRYGY